MKPHVIEVFDHDEVGWIVIFPIAVEMVDIEPLSYLPFEPVFISVWVSR